MSLAEQRIAVDGYTKYRKKKTRLFIAVVGNLARGEGGLVFNVPWLYVEVLLNKVVYHCENLKPWVVSKR
jgi:hypothetical protein